MLVYGDRYEPAEPVQLASDINSQLRAVEIMPAGLERHARLVAALIDGGELLQGLADAGFAETHRDCSTPATDELGAFLVDLAGAVCRSWDSGFRDAGRVPTIALRADWPPRIECRVPEGFAFYALYPEAYIDAARRLKLDAAPRIVGVRSIGTSLGALVAAALGAPPALTVRPFGDPSARTIALDPQLERELLYGDAHYVIVDEGPGMSGSSFGAVADWLEQRGVPRERIAVLPSHAGPPGSAASEKRRRWWQRVQRQVGDFGDRWPQLVAEWSAGLLGILDQAPRDIAGGKWRELHYGCADNWPAVVPAWERRKFLVSARGERFLVRFAGLGRIGEEKLAAARALRSERFVPEPIGLAHGFLVERWCDGTPLRAGDNPLREVARYIGTRARILRSNGSMGASIETLLNMARRNVSLEWGDDLARSLDAWKPHVPELERRTVRVRTDNKLDRHEWLRTSTGALIKTDAVDHHRAHDLIGCQDVAWDVAGATVEFDLDEQRSDEFVQSVDEWAMAKIDRGLLDFYRIAYLAFRLGQARLGERITACAADRERLRRRGDGYAAELQHLLESTCPAPRPRCLVD